MLDVNHAAAALAHLNEICPDTFDEGSFGPWTFTTLSREANTWRLAFSNSTGDDAVRFSFDGACVQGPHNIVNNAWFDAVNAAILVWESEHAEDAEW